MKKIIRWDKQVTIDFAKSIKFISKNSPQNADKVKNDILRKIKKLSQTPYIYSPDKYKIDNDGNYRCFELHYYRISYFIKEKEIIIVRIKHTSQEPEGY